MVFEQAMNGLIVAITSLPADATLLSLPPVFLLEIVCVSMYERPNAVWYSLAAMLIHQLDPPSLTSLISVPSQYSKATVQKALPIIVEACLRCCRPEGAMQAVRLLVSIIRVNTELPAPIES